MKDLGDGRYEATWPITYQSDSHHKEAVCAFDSAACYNAQMIKRYKYWHDELGIVGADPKKFKPLDLYEWEVMRQDFGCPVVPVEQPKVCDYLRGDDYHAAQVRWGEYRRDRLCEYSNPEAYHVPTDREWEDLRAGCPKPPEWARVAIFPYEIDPEILCLANTAQEYNSELDRRFSFWEKNYIGVKSGEPRRYIADDAELAALKVKEKCPTRFTEFAKTAEVDVKGTLKVKGAAAPKQFTGATVTRRELPPTGEEPETPPPGQISFEVTAPAIAIGLLAGVAVLAIWYYASKAA